jgi:hypothetical protein
MNFFRNKIQHAIIVLSGCLFFPFVVFADTSVTLLNASGGPGGSPFVDMAVSKGRITAITVRSGKFIDSIQLTYQYGKKRVNGSAHGGKGGKSGTLKLSAGEFITEFSGRSGKYVDSIYIKTNKNRSKKWGGSGGNNRFKFTGSKQSPILGIWGRSGALLDAIGIVRSSKGGQAINTKGIGGFKQQANSQGGDESKYDSIQSSAFPKPAANKNEINSWLKFQNAKLENIIKSMSSNKEFSNYSKGEKKTCGSSLYCQVTYRRGAISYVTGAE